MEELIYNRRLEKCIKLSDSVGMDPKILQKPTEYDIMVYYGATKKELDDLNELAYNLAEATVMAEYLTKKYEAAKLQLKQKYVPNL